MGEIIYFLPSQRFSCDLAFCLTGQKYHKTSVMLKIQLTPRCSSFPPGDVRLSISSLCCPTFTSFQCKKQKPHEKRKRAANQVLAQLTEFRSIRKTVVHSCMTVGTRVAGRRREKEIDKSKEKKTEVFFKPFSLCI